MTVGINSAIFIVQTMRNIIDEWPFDLLVTFVVIVTGVVGEAFASVGRNAIHLDRLSLCFALSIHKFLLAIHG